MRLSLDTMRLLCLSGDVAARCASSYALRTEQFWARAGRIVVLTPITSTVAGRF